MYLLILILIIHTLLSLYYLHPTMYLLIPEDILEREEFGHNLHPTMYLLIQTITITTANTISRFTSHYVSINSEFEQALDIKAYLFTSHYVSINSAYIRRNLNKTNLIYIPLCIY